MRTKKGMETLKNKKTKLLKELNKYKDIICGSLYLQKRRCGTEKMYPAYFLSRGIKGKTKLTYIPKNDVNKIRKCVQEYKMLKKKIKSLCDINEKIITKK